MRKNEKYPIEVALEKTIKKVGDALAWGIRAFVRFWWVIPKRKDDKVIYMVETIGWLMILLGWIVLTIARYRWFGL
jgi:hypothetical protein